MWGTLCDVGWGGVVTPITSSSGGPARVPLQHNRLNKDAEVPGWKAVL